MSNVNKQNTSIPGFFDGGMLLSRELVALDAEHTLGRGTPTQQGPSDQFKLRAMRALEQCQAVIHLVTDNKIRLRVLKNAGIVAGIIGVDISTIIIRFEAMKDLATTQYEREAQQGLDTVFGGAQPPLGIESQEVSPLDTVNTIRTLLDWAISLSPPNSVYYLRGDHGMGKTTHMDILAHILAGGKVDHLPDLTTRGITDIRMISIGLEDICGNDYLVSKNLHELLQLHIKKINSTSLLTIEDADSWLLSDKIVWGFDGWETISIFQRKYLMQQIERLQSRGGMGKVVIAGRPSHFRTIEDEGDSFGGGLDKTRWLTLQPWA